MPVAKSEVRNHGQVWWLSFIVLFCILGMSGCRGSSATPPVPQAAAKPVDLLSTQAQVDLPEEKSCREFVQGFYDWYINGHLKDDDRGPAWYQVAKQRPYMLSDHLRRLLHWESAENDRAKEIGALDFDPFLAAQDWSEAYKVKAIKVQGNHCDAQVTGSVSLRKIELVRAKSGWIFTNFDNSSYAADGKTKDLPDYDLVQLLAREKEQAKNRNAQK